MIDTLHKKKNKRTLLIIVSVIVLIIVLLIVVVIVLYKTQKSVIKNIYTQSNGKSSDNTTLHFEEETEKGYITTKHLYDLVVPEISCDNGPFETLTLDMIKEPYTSEMALMLFGEYLLHYDKCPQPPLRLEQLHGFFANFDRDYDYVPQTMNYEMNEIKALSEFTHMAYNTIDMNGLSSANTELLSNKLTRKFIALGESSLKHIQYSIYFRDPLA